MPSTIVPTLDLPFFELCNQAPVASGATSAFVTAEDGSDKFIYYISGSSFYRYSVEMDTWQQLANPPTAPSGLVSMRYTKRRGYHGRILAATSSTVTLPNLRQSELNGQTIRIEYGPGAGQERTLTYVSETTHDFGVITGGTGSANITDSTKKWIVNQWAGYTVAFVFNQSVTLYRKILYNDATTLYYSDVNLMPHDPWNNTDLVAASPYQLPNTNPPSMYRIVSAVFNVNTPWTVTPDSTSYFTTLSGGIWIVSSTSAAPFFSLQYYDVLADYWQQKTVPQSLMNAALGTDVSLERMAKFGTPLLSSTAVTSATARTVVASSLALANDRYANCRLLITAGTGAGQNRRIVGNNATTFWLSRSWTTNPDATSSFEIWPDWDRVWMVGNNASSMYAYSPENDFWMQGQSFDDGVTTNISASLTGGWLPLGVSTGVRIAAGITAVNAAPTVGGTNYVLGDVLTCSVGGTGAQVVVTQIAPGGIVTAIALVNSGTATGFTVGTGRATSGGTGTGCTIEITAVGPTATITTASNHFFRTGDVITFAGCTEAAWNANHTILGVPSLTTFCVAVTATANMAATASQSTTVIVDPTKTWITNEHVGRLVQLNVASRTPTSQIRWITANTSNTLTLSAIVTAAVNGTSKYAIYDAKVFGVDDQRPTSGQLGYGWATGGSTTTLVDNTKNWIPNQWAGYFFRIETGTGYGSGRISIISNTETTLTYATQTFTPDATSKYEIADSWGLATAGTTTTITEATSKNWTTNQWVGKRVRFTSGTSMGNELAISASAANNLTFTTTTAPDTSTAYAILGIQNRASGIELIYPYETTVDTGKYMWSIRGGGTNQIDIYDITTGRWVYGIHTHPQNELFTSGSSYSYAGGNKILLTRTANTSVVRVLELDVVTREIVGRATTTWLSGTVTIGNIMEVVTASGYPIVYVLQSGGTLLSRAVLI